jgi:hypothetical protein
MRNSLAVLAARATLLVACGSCAVALSAVAQAQEPSQPPPAPGAIVTLEPAEKGVWPDPSPNQWYWHEARTDLGAPQVDDVLARLGNQVVFRVAKFWNAVYAAKRIRVKGAFAKASGLRFDADWRSLTTSVKGSDGVVVPLERVRDIEVWYRPDARSWLGDRATEFRWSLDVTADQDYRFFLREEDDARQLGDVVASLLAAGGRTLPRKSAGMYLSDLTPRQATDLGWTRVEGVLVVNVAIGGPADRAGLQSLDVILEIAGEKVRNGSQAVSRIGRTPAPVRMSLLRRRVLAGAVPRQYAWEPRTVELDTR